MKHKVFTLNSFAKTEQGGNPAGVVLNANELSEKQMRAIAKQVGFSETAFIMDSEVADFKVRFFTPSEEVDLCGHATIAAFYVLAKEGSIKAGSYTQETKAGVLYVEVCIVGNSADISILMDQAAPQYFEEVEKQLIADSLSLPVEALMEQLPVQVVSTGLKDILVPVKSIAWLNSIVAKQEKIEEISRLHDVTGYHVFTLETLNEPRSTAHCRNFAPLFGIPEESATGTSNGALGCYLFKHGVISNEQAKRMVVEQGYSMNQPSEIHVSLEIEGNVIHRVKVGGSAMRLESHEITL